jgi:hypothetical protein
MAAHFEVVPDRIAVLDEQDHVGRGGIVREGVHPEPVVGGRAPHAGEVVEGVLPGRGGVVGRGEKVDGGH